MNETYLFPGTFDPPTYGHLEVLRKVLSRDHQIYIVCSVNEDKNPIFTPEESRELWKHYKLPETVNIVTLKDLVLLKPNLENTIMIRGIRDNSDFDHEKKVLFQNYEQYDIDKYLYVVSDNAHRYVSSTKARKAIEDLDLCRLPDMICPMVVSKMLEKRLGINKIYLVVGKPGAGKSTFIKLLKEQNPNIHHIKTDDFNKKLQNIIKVVFPNEDPMDVAINKPEQLRKLLTEPWMKLAKEQLLNVPKGSKVFVEAAYGLQTTKNLFKYFGGRIVYVGTDGEDKLEKRNAGRKTEHLMRFSPTIPDLEESEIICKQNNLEFMHIDTSSSLKTFKKTIASMDYIL